MKTQSQVNREVKQDATKGLILQFIGILAALLPLLGVLGINLEWFNQGFIDGLEVLLLAVVAFVVNAYTIYKNHYSGKKAQEQNAELKSRGLK
ncbi:phage holin [Microbulbifer pacificus]|uniref:phage holin n=1 Tax=Microbulbifer pacificus TaxID=407164 RepID=UPI000CF3D076|nr:phage holin [Microbulbifer pacificus]